MAIDDPLHGHCSPLEDFGSSEVSLAAFEVGWGAAGSSSCSDKMLPD